VEDNKLNPKYDEYRARRGPEQKLWETWHTSGRKEEHLVPLLKSIEPLIKSEARNRMAGLGGSIPGGALRAQLQSAAVQGIHSYDPSLGVPLSSHIYGNFRRVNDFVAANRNAKYMPREHVDTYQQLKNVQEELKTEIGREPTPLELQERLGWGAKKVKRMLRGFGSEVYSDMGTDLDDPESRMNVHGAFQLVRSKLKPDEVRFGELQFPVEGTPPSIKQIAKTLGVSQHRAYRLKSRVETHLAKVLKNE
jgi:DNA-directed RNA polymerase specialized sigma subunit